MVGIWRAVLGVLSWCHFKCHPGRIKSLSYHHLWAWDNQEMLKKVKEKPRIENIKKQLGNILWKRKWCEKIWARFPQIIQLLYHLVSKIVIYFPAFFVPSFFSAHSFHSLFIFFQLSWSITDKTIRNLKCTYIMMIWYTHTLWKIPHI